MNPGLVIFFCRPTFFLLIIPMQFMAMLISLFGFEKLAGNFIAGWCELAFDGKFHKPYKRRGYRDHAKTSTT